MVLNGFVGSTQFCEREFTETVRSLEPVLDDVAALENTHLSFTLLKFCLVVCKVNYQLRVTPPESTITGAKLFDGLIEKCLRLILGGILDTDVSKELQLPDTTSFDYPHICIGLTSAADTAAAAFIGSSAACDKLVSMAMAGSILQGPRGYAFAKQAHAAWASQCEEGAALPLEAFEVDRPPQQKTIAALVHARKIKALPQGSTHMRIFREHMTLPEAKSWVQCRPSKTLRTLIKLHNFTTWMKYYCQVPLFQSGTKCPPVQCDSVMDIYGDHLLHFERRIQ